MQRGVPGEVAQAVDRRAVAGHPGVHPGQPGHVVAGLVVRVRPGVGGVAGAGSTASERQVSSIASSKRPCSWRTKASSPVNHQSSPYAGIGPLDDRPRLLGHLGDAGERDRRHRGGEQQRVAAGRPRGARPAAGSRRARGGRPRARGCARARCRGRVQRGVAQPGPDVDVGAQLVAEQRQRGVPEREGRVVRDRRGQRGERPGPQPQHVQQPARVRRRSLRAGRQGVPVGVATRHESRVDHANLEFQASAAGCVRPDRRVEACPLRRTGPDPGSIPTQPGVYRFRDAARPGDLRRQGQEPAGPAVVVLPGHRQPARPHRDDGHHRRQRRVDGGQHRGRGAAAGVLLDQGVRPAVQREVPRRQVLPVARGDGGRRVPAGDGRPRRQAQGHPLLRPLQPRLGDPRDRRHPAAGLPDAQLLQRRVQALRPDRPAVPARLHRQVLGTVRRQHQRRGPPRRSSTTSATSWPARPGRSSGASSGRCTPPPSARTTRRRPGSATTSARWSGRWRSRRSCSATAPTST